MQYTPETLAGMTETELADHYFSAIDIDGGSGCEKAALAAIEGNNVLHHSTSLKSGSSSSSRNDGSSSFDGRASGGTVASTLGGSW